MWKKANFAHMKYYLANFSHDLAISHNGIFYTPPPNVRIMERDLAELCDFFQPRGPVSYNCYAPVWGWDNTIVSKLKSCGFENLPTPLQLEKIRSLSSRKVAVQVLGNVRSLLPDLPLMGESFVCTSEEELLDKLALGKLVLKEPLSGSGRGLRFVDKKLTPHQLNWALRCIREQGCVVAEPLYDKVQDFALEFLVSESKIDYSGLSVFGTNQTNVYSGNIIAPQQSLWEKLYAFADCKVFDLLLQNLTKILHNVFVGNYLGPIGVDMMIVRKGGKLFIHPCVEINVRRTMGMLSLQMANLVSLLHEAEFKLLYRKNQREMQQLFNTTPKPEFDKEGKLTAGILWLTKVNADTHFAAVIEVQ